jgi:biotin carboxylase
MSQQLTFLCLANYLKGLSFLEECRRLDLRTIVITNAKLKNEAWPECIDEIFFVHDLADTLELSKAVSYLAKTRQIDVIVPLDDYAVETAASLREHLRLPGMGESTARYFRDKLAMRIQAREAGLNVPDFVHLLNRDRVDEFLQSVEGPWLIKPRSEAGSVQIKKCYEASDIWKWADTLGDREAWHLIEAFLPGEVFHVDSIVFDNKVLFSAPHRYWRPPFDVWNGGGIFMSQSVPSFDEVYHDLLEANAAAIKAMGLPYGVTHVEFIRSKADGKLYFLELASRVGGAHIDHLVEAQTGVDLWREWARVEAAFARGEQYTVQTTPQLHGGILLCLSRQCEPDLSVYHDPEVCWRLGEGYHAGLVIASENFDRVTQLMTSYRDRFHEEIVAVAPPTDKPA